MPRETDDDLLHLISEIHGQSPLAAAEAHFARAVDDTERRTRLAARQLSALTDGRSLPQSDPWGLDARDSGPMRATAPPAAEAPMPASEAEATALFRAPEAPPQPRELTRRIRQMPGGHVESGSGRELHWSNGEPASPAQTEKHIKSRIDKERA